MQIPQDLPFQVNPEYFKSLDAGEQLTKEEVEGYIAYAYSPGSRPRRDDVMS
jgi:hypothetical protein